MGYTRFPTPALSPGERGNGPPRLDHTRAGVCLITIGKTPIRRLLFPLPGERVRVRGKYSVEHAKCSISQGLLSTRTKALHPAFPRFHPAEAQFHPLESRFHLNSIPLRRCLVEHGATPHRCG